MIKFIINLFKRKKSQYYFESKAVGNINNHRRICGVDDAFSQRQEHPCHGYQISNGSQFSEKSKSTNEKPTRMDANRQHRD